MVSERHILGTQLVRRNDELALLNEKLRCIQLLMSKGEAVYNERVKDIQVLRLEIRNLRNKIVLLEKDCGILQDLKYSFFLIFFPM